MEKNSKKIRYFLFFLVMLLLIAPAVQQCFGVIRIKRLHGAITEPQKAILDDTSWFSGSYQQKAEVYLNESFGFRNITVRINNQIGFSLFNKARANGVIIGKENYLYEKAYIDAYYGTDYIGDKSTSKRMKQLKFLQDTLQRLNKDFVLVFAAGKGSYYPEYIPEKYKREKRTTNHDAHLAKAKELGLNYIDWHTYFLENKNKSTHPLYPKYGIHWSYYSMCLVADSMIRYIEKTRNIDMANVYWDEINIEPINGGDYDIADGLNILYKLGNDEMAYPRVKLESDSGKTKPSILVIADSFYWGIVYMGIENLYSKHDFWFYNQRPEGAKQKPICEEIATHDVILIMATEATLSKLGWGFIEEAYNGYNKHYETNENQ